MKTEKTDPLDAGFRRGHAHRWCDEECKKNDCEFGPCCVLEEVEMVFFEEDVEVL